jgi:putative exporter of polyketide antibiotics
MKRIFEIINIGSYLFSAILLYLMSITIMGWSVYEVVDHLQNESLTKGAFISTMLQSVGAIVIAIAIIDVAKYMIEEEVHRTKELRSIKEARHTITKITVIIAIAVSMEGLVYIFKAGTTDIMLLVYPASLLLVSMFLIIGLGIYQKLSVEAEKNSKKVNSVSSEDS